MSLNTPVNALEQGFTAFSWHPLPHNTRTMLNAATNVLEGELTDDDLRRLVVQLRRASAGGRR